jgi:hypothetical protein
MVTAAIWAVTISIESHVVWPVPVVSSFGVRKSSVTKRR